MDTMTDHVKLLYNDDGTLFAALISPQLWSHLEPEAWKASQELNAPPQSKKPKEALAEPLEDWEELLRFWDFPYPVDLDVACEHCGQRTENWRNEEPRRFRLSAANLGGLVTFACLSCGSKIIKRHFKDTITTECHPPQARDQRKMGLYSKR